MQILPSVFASVTTALGETDCVYTQFVNVPIVQSDVNITN